MNQQTKQLNGQPNGESNYNQSINTSLNSPTHYSTSNYQTDSVTQLLPKQQERFQQNKVITQQNYSKPINSDLMNRRSIPLNQTAYPKQPFNTGQHTINSANFNTYIFDKQPNGQYNIESLARNGTHLTYNQMPIYKQTNNLNSDCPSYNGQMNNALNTFNCEQNHSNFIRNNSLHQTLVDDSIKHFDLTKFQTYNKLPKFKDFNAKPKIFIRSCT